MEAILDAYFEDVFSRLARDYLLARHRRKQLADYFGHVIAGFCRGSSEEPQRAVARAVSAAVDFHRRTKRDNGGSVCLMGKYHDLLYVAAKLCFDWKLENNTVVSALLQEMFECERSFEKLIAGSIFGPNVTYLISGWKSDALSHSESIFTLKYFLEHALMAQQEFDGQRMADVLMPEYQRSTPLKVAIYRGIPDVVLLLLRYGAKFNFHLNEEEVKLLPFPISLKCYEQLPIVVFPNLTNTYTRLCVQFVLRAVPLALPFPGERQFDSRWSDAVYIRYDDFGGEVAERFPLVLPEVPKLKHLCKCVVRQRLWENHELPKGISGLPLPESLHKYLDLMVD